MLSVIGVLTLMKSGARLKQQQQQQCDRRMI